MQRPATVIALSAGLIASGLAFFSSAGAEDRRMVDPPARLSTAIFAGGCFACVEADFDKIDGIIETIPGYTGGTVDNPGYKIVSQGQTGHYEAVKVTYNPSKVTYDELATYFLRHIDPTDANGQFCEQGDNYRSAFFVSGRGERDAAEKALEAAARSLKQDVATQILPAATFWPAEESHQDYAVRSTGKYAEARKACGRDAKLEQLWGSRKGA